MIDRQHGKIVIECDSCHEVFETDIEDFHEALAETKLEGWRVSKRQDVWTHTCRDCVGAP